VPTLLVTKVSLASQTILIIATSIVLNRLQYKVNTTWKLSGEQPTSQCGQSNHTGSPVESLVREGKDSTESTIDLVKTGQVDKGLF
jgi:hypothetical protein